jgi:hypothetical protein
MMPKMTYIAFCDICQKTTKHYMRKSDDGQFDLGLKCIDCAADELEKYLKEIEAALEQFKNRRSDPT